MKRITNLSGRVQCLADGTMLAAAGTNGSSKLVEIISAADVTRLGGLVHVEEAAHQSPEQAPKSPTSKTPAPDSAAKKEN